MSRIKNIVIILSSLLVAQVTFGQTDSIIEVIDAFGSGNRIIKPSKKKNLVPSLINDTSQSQIKSDFVFFGYNANSQMKLQPIKAAKLKIIPPLEKLKRGYIKGGVGMYTTPLVEIYYNSLRSKKSNWGIHGRHISSNSSLKNTGFSGLSENSANAFYQHFYKKFSLTGEVNYDRNANHFYGFNTEDTTIDKNDIKQVFNSIGGSINVASFQNDTGDINYDGKLSYVNYSDHFSATENNVLLDLKLQKMFNRTVFSVDFGVDFNTYSSIQSIPLDDVTTTSFPSKTVNNTILKFIPNLISSGEKLYVKVGLGIYADLLDKSKFYFSPNIEAKYSFHDIFIPYIGINNGLERNSFRSLSQENPFILSQVNLQNTVTRYNLYAGVRGSISNTVTFNMQVARKSIFGRALYFTDTVYSIQNKMDVLYDTMDITEINGQITYQQSEKLRVLLKGKYSFLNPLGQDYVWNVPAIDVTLGAVYDLADKFLVRADVFFIGDRKAKSLIEVEGATLNKDDSYSVNQKAFVDFNLGLEYRYSKNVSAFLNFNNIIGQKYLMYYRYPVQGINILGGATLRF